MGQPGVHDASAAVRRRADLLWAGLYRPVVDPLRSFVLAHVIGIVRNSQSTLLNQRRVPPDAVQRAGAMAPGKSDSV